MSKSEISVSLFNTYTFEFSLPFRHGFDCAESTMIIKNNPTVKMDFIEFNLEFHIQPQIKEILANLYICYIILIIKK